MFWSQLREGYHDTGMVDEREQPERALAACLQAVESGKATDLYAALAEPVPFDMADFFSASSEVENVTAPMRSLMPPENPVFAIG